MGPSGTGKTTLLRLITAQIAANSGTVSVLGQELGKADKAEIYSLRRRMGMLFQNGALLTDINVFENVAFPVRENTDLPEPLIRRLVLSKLQAVGLRGAAELYVQIAADMAVSLPSHALWLGQELAKKEQLLRARRTDQP